MSKSSEWITKGFDAFSRGECGNAGQNLYVSRAGVLQRIHLFDVNRDGYADLVFCNSQAFFETPPAYLYVDPLGGKDRVELPADGGITGAVADLNGDGYDDIIIGNERNGATFDVNAIIYYGGPEGYGERRMALLPAPKCLSVAVGDFNGDGRPDIAFVCRDGLRVFYQTELGFEPMRFTDYELSAEQITAADLNGDGFADIYALMKDAPPRILWGGEGGVDPQRFTEVTAGWGVEKTIKEETSTVSEPEKVGAVGPMARAVVIEGVPHLFVPFAERAYLVPVSPDGVPGEPMIFEINRALAVAAGDVNGDGRDDLVFAARQPGANGECSRIYWGAADGFDEKRSLDIPADRVCDVALRDIDGDGCADIVLCRNQDDKTYSLDSLLFRGGGEVVSDPIKLPSEGARRVFSLTPGPDSAPALLFVNRISGKVRGDENPVIYLGGPDGFSPDRKWEITALGAAAAVVCDINDDGYPDALVANGAENAMHLDPGSYVFLGGPDGLPLEPDIVLPTIHGWGFAVADLNRDGFLDLIVAEFATTYLEIYYGNENGFDLENPERVSTELGGEKYDQPRRIYLADLNNNGWLDLVVSQVQSDRCFILWGGPDGFDSESRQMLSAMRGSCPHAVDLTGNGYLDLLIASHKPDPEGPHNAFLYIYWNGSDGLREDRKTLLPCNAALCIATADFNGDGHLDIFVGSYHDGKKRDIDSYIYWGGPGGSFSRSNFTPIRTHSCSGCLAADFDGDGRIDLAVCNHKTFHNHFGDSFVYWNGPDGFDESRITRLPTAGAHGMMLVQPGNQRDRGPEEYYMSESYEMPEGATLKSISWEAELPPKSWVRARIRFADSPDALTEASWIGPDGKAEGWFESESDVFKGKHAGRWIQYQLALGAVNSGCTPRVTEVRVRFE